MYKHFALALVCKLPDNHITVPGFVSRSVELSWVESSWPLWRLRILTKVQELNKTYLCVRLFYFSCGKWLCMHQVNFFFFFNTPQKSEKKANRIERFHSSCAAGALQTFWQRVYDCQVDSANPTGSSYPAAWLKHDTHRVRKSVWGNGKVLRQTVFFFTPLFVKLDP